MSNLRELEASTGNEKIILDYLKNNASETLAEKINNGTKTLSQCWSYITSEARKLAQNGCAVVDDETVFGWAIHFFEEDSIEGKNYAAKSATTNKTPKPTKKKESVKVKEEPTQLEQLNLFDMQG